MTVMCLGMTVEMCLSGRDCHERCLGVTIMTLSRHDCHEMCLSGCDCHEMHLGMAVMA